METDLNWPRWCQVLGPGLEEGVGWDEIDCVSPGQGEGLLGSCPVISALPRACPLASVGAADNSARGPHPALRTQFT